MIQGIESYESSVAVKAFPRGVKLLHDPVRNKGTAFTDACLLYTSDAADE